uniref:Uncharacterized protein n=1 Tax=Lactuca sativa TaxID=4236 RepID=A0A9R1XUE3_LACSA|nr:hypothetical protein LSAT_V11C100038750 [Lactuca sativa]
MISEQILDYLLIIQIRWWEKLVASVLKLLSSANGLEFMKSVADKNHDLLRPSTCYFSMFKGPITNSDNDIYNLIRDDADDFQQGIYDKPLPFFGCGVGWFS